MRSHDVRPAPLTVKPGVLVSSSATKLGLLVALLWLDPSLTVFKTSGHFISYELYLYASIYLAIASYCVAALVVCAFSGSLTVRTINALLVLVGYVASFVYHAIAGTGIGIEAAVTLWTERGLMSNSMSAYSAVYLTVTAIVLVASLALIVLPSYTVNVGKIAGGAILASALLITYGIAARTAGFTVAFPSAFAIPAAFAYAVLSSTLYNGPRDGVDVVATSGHRPTHIILIVDESIRGDYLGLNNPDEATTPFLQSQRRSLVTFGLATSATNCSGGSNLILRTGLRREALPDVEGRSFRVPSVWQFAKRAGFRTVFIDAQHVGGSLDNYMNDSERNAIDEFRQFDDVPGDRRDMAAASVLRGILQSGVPTFAYVNKMGAHFGYDDRYPASEKMFAPALPDGGNALLRERLINSYKNAIRWSVDGFFRLALTDMRLEEAVLIYTSDHGQNLMDDGKLITHCRAVDPQPMEGTVPMLVLSGDRKFLSGMREMSVEKCNGVSHFEIFPTILRLFGYEKGWIFARYGASLFDPAAAELKFYSGRPVLGRGSGGWYVRGGGGDSTKGHCG